MAFNAGLEYRQIPFGLDQNDHTIVGVLTCGRVAEPIVNSQSSHSQCACKYPLVHCWGASRLVLQNAAREMSLVCFKRDRTINASVNTYMQMLSGELGMVRVCVRIVVKS